MKKCSKCDNEKEISEFNFRKDTQKYRNQCGDCIKLINKEYRTMNKDEIKIGNKEYRNNTENMKRLYAINYRERNRENIQLYKKNYFQNNEEESYDKLKKKKIEENNFRSACNLRKRVLNAFRSQKVRKTNKTFCLLGCSHSFLRRWIESQLYGEMTLENYGKFWCLHHCLAVATFNLLDENDMKKCFNWINLKPLYVKDNIIKGDKIDMTLYLLQEIRGKYFMKLNVEKDNIKTLLMRYTVNHQEKTSY